MLGSQTEVICNTGLCAYVKVAYATKHSLVFCYWIKQLLVFLM